MIKVWLLILLVLASGMQAISEQGGGNTVITTEQAPEVNPPDYDAPEVGDDIVIPEHEILLVYRRTNYAWGACNRGYIIDTDGCFYEFDYVHDGYGTIAGDGVSFVDYLEYVIENTKGMPAFDQEFVKQVYALGADLSADDQFEETYEMCDYGQETLLFYRPETKELLKCESKGDTHYKPKNESAAKIAQLFEKSIMGDYSP